MPEPESILRFEDVSVCFDQADDANLALANVSFDVRAGQTRIILGAAGSGKTVMLKTAIGLVTANSGKVLLFDKEIHDLPESELFAVRRKVGMLFQESALFDSLSIERNVAYPLITASAHANGGTPLRQRIQQALDFVEIGQTLKQFPSELSGGMRRRAAIARAVVTQPPLLLYDSPTAGLDPITAHTIMALIIKERDLDNTTALVVTHRYQDGNLVANFRYNPESAQLDPARDDGAKKTIFMVLKEGRLVFEGSQTELEANTDEYISKFVKREETNG